MAVALPELPYLSSSGPPERPNFREEPKQLLKFVPACGLILGPRPALARPPPFWRGGPKSHQAPRQGASVLVGRPAGRAMPARHVMPLDGPKGRPLARTRPPAQLALLGGTDTARV